MNKVLVECAGPGCQLCRALEMAKGAPQATAEEIAAYGLGNCEEGKGYA